MGLRVGKLLVKRPFCRNQPCVSLHHTQAAMPHSYKAHPSHTASSGSAFSEFLREQHIHFYNVFPDAKAYYLESHNMPTIPYNMVESNDFLGDVFFQYDEAASSPSLKSTYSAVDHEFGPLQTRAIQASNELYRISPHTESLQDYEFPTSPPTTSNLSLDACPGNVQGGAPMLITQTNQGYSFINPAGSTIDRSNSVSPCIYPPQRLLCNSPTKVYTPTGFTISASKSRKGRSPDIDPVGGLAMLDQHVRSPCPSSSRTRMETLPSNNTLEQTATDRRGQGHDQHRDGRRRYNDCQGSQPPSTPLSPGKFGRRASCISGSPGPSPRPTMPLSPLSTKRQLGKKPPLACLFCRGRKIACGRPVPGNMDKTCNQCRRRSLRCEYPSESRRGMRKKMNSVDQANKEGYPTTTSPPPKPLQISTALCSHK